MWCLIVSIPEVRPLSYFEKSYALLYPYIKSFSMSDPWRKDLMNRAPERRIDLASGTCNKIMSALSFKIMKRITQKLCRIFQELIKLLNFGIQLFLKENNNILKLF